MHPLKLNSRIREIHHCATSYNQNGKSIADYRYKSSEPLKLLVKRGLYTIIYLRSNKHLAVLSVVTHCEHLHHPMPFHNLGTAHHMVRRKCGIRIKIIRISGLMRHRLPCQC